MDRKIYLSRKNKVIAGVCGGVAEYFSVDPTLIRIIWAIVTISLSVTLMPIIIYIICWAVMPLPPEDMGGMY